MDSLNVMHVADFGAANPGNFINSLLALEDALKARGGSAVYVFPARAKERYWVGDMERAGRKLYFLPGGVVRDALLLRRAMRENNITVLHSHFAHSNIYLPLRLARTGRFWKTPYFVHVHSLYQKQPRGLREKIENLIIGEKLYICVGDGAAEPLRARGRRCRVVDNAIDFSRLDRHEAAREEIMGDRDGKLAVIFGYNFQIKGVDTALKALDRYDGGRRYTLGVVVTNHADEAHAQIDALFGRVPEWVRLLPARDDVASYYRAADVFLSASRTEGMPYAPVEAACCETPVALTDIPGHDALKAVPGFVVFPPDDERALFEALEAASAGDRPTAAAKRYVSERFRLERWTREIIEIYCDGLR